MYKKLRFFFRLYKAFIKKYFILLLLGLACGIATFFLLPKITSSLPKVRTISQIGIVGVYSLSNLPIEIQHQISLGLTIIDTSGQPVPSIAKSWTTQDSGKTYVFEINTSLKWQNGANLTSKDIQYNFKDAAIEYPDSSHLVFKLQDPYSPLPTVLARPIFKSISAKHFLEKSEYLGLGSYKIQNYHKNGQYLDWILLTPVTKASNLPNLKYTFYSSLQQAKTAFKLGLIDTLTNLSDPAELTAWPKAKITPVVQLDRHMAIFFNTQDPQLQGASGKNLRLSLAYAIDKSKFTNRALGPFSKNSWVASTNLKTYELDLTKAKSLLEKVEKIPDQLTLTTLPLYLPTANQIKLDWEALGLHVNLQVLPEIPPDFQILLVTQAIPTDPDQYNLWHSTQETTNLTHLKNPRIDKLLEDGRKTFDPKERLALYTDFQKYLLDEVPAVFLYYPTTYILTRN